MGEDTHTQHRVRIDVVGNQITTSIDGQQVHQVTDDTHTTGTIGFRQFGNEHARFDDVRVTDPDGSILFEDDFEHALVRHFTEGTIEGGQLDLQGTGVVLRSERNRNPSPLLRTEMSFDRSVVNARAYVCGLGFYELFVNGEYIGDRVLDPAQTDYADTVLYATHDVTDALRSGENAIGVALGRGRFGELAENVWGWDDAPWWSDPQLRLQIEVEFADGSTTTISSNESWRITDGPTRRDSLFAGEFYDARTEKSGWTTPGYDDADWSAVEPVDAPAGKIASQVTPPIETFETIEPVSVSEPEPDVYVFDVGQMIAGWTELTVDGPEGTAVKLTMGEKLHADGTVNNANRLISEPMQTDTYVLDGQGTETWESRFSYKGFRFIQVENFPGKPTTDNIRATVVHTAIDENADSDFACSNNLLTQIHENTQWAFLNNHHGIPTDTPTYEKNGWTGDALVTAETGLFNFKLARFYTKWLRDVRDAQLDAPEVIDEKGNVPVIAPSPDMGYKGWTPDPAWQSVYVLITWWVYRYYGDRRVLEEHYDGLKSYVHYLGRKADDHIVRDGLGDWVAPDGGPLPPEGPGIVSTAYYYRDVEVLAEIASILGHENDASEFEQLAADIAAAFNDEFFDDRANVYSTGTVDEYRQTSNVFPLAYDLIPEEREEAVARNLAENVMSVHDGHLDTGAHGTKYLLPVLTEYGYHDVAYTVATQRTYPSWGHWIENGMTALLEHWSLNSRSRDHHFLGSIDEWFYKYLAGITLDEPGFERLRIKPYVPDDLDEVTASTETVRGTVASNWEQRNENVFAHEVSIPATTTAEMHVPAEYRWAVTESERLAVEAAEIEFLRMEDGYAVFQVGSGDYDFESDPILGRFGLARHLATELQEIVSSLRSDGDLTDGQANYLRSKLSKLSSQLNEAMAARIEGDRVTVEERVQQALVTVNQVRRWIRTQVADDELAPKPAETLQDPLRRVDRTISTNSEVLFDVETDLLVRTDEVFAGATARVEATMHNGGSEKLNDVAVSLSPPEGLTTSPVGKTKTGVVDSGETFVATFDVAVPLEQSTGPVSLGGEVTFRHRGGTVQSPLETTIDVKSPVAFSSFEADPAKPGETTELQATVRNRIDRPVSGRVEVTVPDRWEVNPTTRTYRVSAGGTRSVTFAVDVPDTAVEDHVVSAIATYGDNLGERASGLVDVRPQVVIIDGFEDGDIDEYDGDVGGYSVTEDAPVFHGSSSLKMPTAGRERRISSSSGLKRYPSAGDIVKYDFQLGSASDTLTFVFGAQSEGANPPNRYDLNLNSPSNTLLLWRIEDGDPVKIASATVDVGDHLNEWIEGTVEWSTDGTIACTLTDASGVELASLSATDATFSHGGIGFRTKKTKSSPGVAIDYVRTLREPTVVDDFEDGDMEEYAGHVDGYSVTTDEPVYHGSSSLKMPTAGRERRISSTSGLDKYPSAGDIVKYDFQLGSASDTLTFVFGAQSEGANPPNRYDLNLNSPSNTLLLWRIEDGSPIQLASTPVNIGDYVGEWIEGTVDWAGDGTIACRLVDASGTEIASLSGSDDSYNNGGISFRTKKTDNSPGVSIDYVRTL
jgi:alpha-L-rhamnosidase